MTTARKIPVKLCLEQWARENPLTAADIGADEALGLLYRSQKAEAEWADLIERLATAGYRLMQLAGGAEVADGDMLFACKEGTFCEEIAQQRIRWLLRCEKAIKSLAGQIASPATSKEEMVAQILGEPLPKGKYKRANR